MVQTTNPGSVFSYALAARKLKAYVELRSAMPNSHNSPAADEKPGSPALPRLRPIRKPPTG
eukprot:5670252-Alexandrium_andersonii.AAC.1